MMDPMHPEHPSSINRFDAFGNYDYVDTSPPHNVPSFESLKCEQFCDNHILRCCKTSCLLARWHEQPASDIVAREVHVKLICLSGPSEWRGHPPQSSSAPGAQSQRTAAQHGDPETVSPS